MVIKESIAFIDSNYQTDFRNAIPANASQYADISVSGDALPAGQTKFCIESVRLLAMENKDYRVEFYNKSLAVNVATGTFNVNSLLGWVNFYSAATLASTPTILQGQQLTQVATAYATMYAYFAQNLKIPYEDKAQSKGGYPTGGQLHVNLVATGAAKSAGDVGAVHLRFGVVATA